MSDHIADSSPTLTQDAARTFNYPWAAAPDIIRANQKDAYFQSALLTHLSSVIRALYGTRQVVRRFRRGMHTIVRAWRHHPPHHRLAVRGLLGPSLRKALA